MSNIQSRTLIKTIVTPIMSEKKSPNPYKGVPNPTLPDSDNQEAIFLSTLTEKEFTSQIMPLNSRLYMYHVDNTDMCTSDEDSGPELNGTESEDANDRKPAAVADSDIATETSAPPNVSSDDSKLVAVIMEDVDPVASISACDLATQTPSPPAVSNVDLKLEAVKMEDVEPVLSKSSTDVSTQTPAPVVSSDNIKVKMEPDTYDKQSSPNPNIDSPHSISTSSTARSSRASMRDGDFSDSDPEVEKATPIKQARNGKSGKKTSRPISYCQMYGRSMLVAPPKKPMSPQDIIPDERCDYCGRIGDQCLNMRFGKFCVAYCYRYYCNNPTTFTQAGIVDAFKEAYKNAYDRDLFLKNQSLTLKTPPLSEVVLPGCLEARSLIFAINMVLWEYMIAETEKAAGYPLRKRTKKKSKPSKK